MPNMGVRSIAVMIGTLLLSPACDLYCAHKPIYDAVRHEDPRALDRRIRRGDSPDYLLYLAGDMSRPGAVAYLLRKYPPGTQPSHRKDYKYGQDGYCEALSRAINSGSDPDAALATLAAFLDNGIDPNTFTANGFGTVINTDKCNDTERRDRVLALLQRHGVVVPDMPGASDCFHILNPTTGGPLVGLTDAEKAAEAAQAAENRRQNAELDARIAAEAAAHAAANAAAGPTPTPPPAPPPKRCTSRTVYAKKMVCNVPGDSTTCSEQTDHSNYTHTRPSASDPRLHRGALVDAAGHA